MLWASAASVSSEPDTALRNVLDGVVEQMGGARPDLVVVFVSGDHARAFEPIREQLSQKLPGAVLLGCVAHGVIGGGRELEARNALSLTAAHLPQVRIAPFSLESGQLGEGPESWAEIVGLEGGDRAHFILLADPFSADVESIVAGLDAAYPEGVKIGGLASGGARPGDHALCAGERSTRSGVVGVALAGDVVIDPIVAQGCRPIGDPLLATAGRDNLLLELDGRSPLSVLQELFERSSPKDQALFQTSLFIGLEMREERTEYAQGDFLVRNILGIDPQSGSIAVGAAVRTPQVVQFHLRDRETSAEDLERCLSRYGDRESSPRGALMFSCVGRGAGLYGVPDHDSDAFRRHLPGVPLGGFFGNGEIGPVEQQTFLHAYTSAFGVFRPSS